MKQAVARPRSTSAALVFDLLDPIPFGLFVAALIFDVIYAKSAEILWVKSAAWLIAIGLLFAVLPRLIDLVRVWFPGARGGMGGVIRGEMAGFWLNAFAIVAAIFNAFVHSRDAYATMPEGMWLSIATVGLMVIAKIALTLQRSKVEA